MEYPLRNAAYKPDPGDTDTKDIELNIKANDLCLADNLLKPLSDEDADAVAQLPDKKAQIVDASDAKKLIGICVGLDTIVSKKGGQPTMMIIVGAWPKATPSTVWALLISDSHQNRLPMVQYLIGCKMSGFKKLSRGGLDTSKLHPEFLQCTGSTLSALIKHYFFMSGVFVPYDLHIKSRSYKQEILKATKYKPFCTPPSEERRKNQRNHSAPLHKCAEKTFESQWKSLDDETGTIKSLRNGYQYKLKKAQVERRNAEQAVLKAQAAVQKATQKIKDLQRKDVAMASREMQKKLEKESLLDSLSERERSLFKMAWEGGRKSHERGDEEPLLKRQRK
ncbi:unnamed protein product [Periconia digitata]|uniref:Uncharacterized protein n=1 Tax=Periconia digitata TaxID=1303443 RepID=A0A9W4XIV7_9PLEO|nr:unnamed protein product [Periconia digitata]